jgi:hypothetical protein
MLIENSKKEISTEDQAEFLIAVRNLKHIKRQEWSKGTDFVEKQRQIISLLNEGNSRQRRNVKKQSIDQGASKVMCFSRLAVDLYSESRNLTIFSGIIFNS